MWVAGPLLSARASPSMAPGSDPDHCSPTVSVSGRRGQAPTLVLKHQYDVGTESAGIGYGEEVYEEMMLHPSLRPENQAPEKGN